MNAAQISALLDKNPKLVRLKAVKLTSVFTDPGGARLSLTPSDLPKSDPTPAVGIAGDIGHKMSAEAFERAQPKMSRTKRLILMALQANPHGLTRSELAATLAIPKDSANPRTNELIKAGLVQCVSSRDGEGVITIKQGVER